MPTTKKTYLKSLVLLLLQCAGYALIAVLKLRYIAPMAELLNVSPWWDFSACALWALLVALPAVVAYVRRWRLRWLLVAVAALPMVAVLCVAAVGIVMHGYKAYQLKHDRMSCFDEPAEVEQVIGVKFPDYRVTHYSETFYPSKLLSRYSCRNEAEFTEVPSEDFFRQLDSLCVVDTVHWHKNKGAYAYNNIHGRKLLSKLVLSVVLAKGEKPFEIRYDDLGKTIIE